MHHRQLDDIHRFELCVAMLKLLSKKTGTGILKEISIVSRLTATFSGLWTQELDAGLWTQDAGPWTLDSEP